jgi:hypothetical protein
VPEPRKGCEVVVFFGKGSCMSCEIGLMRQLQNDCLKDSGNSIKFVLYYKGKSIGKMFESIKSEIEVLGYDDNYLKSLPIEILKRDSVKKPVIFIIANGQVILDYRDFSVPLNFSKYIGDCSICQP